MGFRRAPFHEMGDRLIAPLSMSPLRSPRNGPARLGHRVWILALLLLSAPLAAQVPLNAMTPQHRAWAQSILQKPDFTFETRTVPVRVRLSTMEKLFDHPRVAAAMWRHCQFAPGLYAFELPGGQLTIDDGRGLRGTLTLAHRQPGMRVYLIDGRVEKGRMNNPFAVGARMIVIYQYWESSKGFESHLQTWTALDSALLSLISRPFRGYIRHRQQEFIAYITDNIAKGGEFAQIDPLEFRRPLHREGDPIAIRQFEEIFGGARHPGLGHRGTEHRGSGRG